MSHSQIEKDDHHSSGFGVYIVTWLALLGLTTITVTVAGMKLPGISVLVAVVIATVKAGAVLYLFMHLKNESLTLKTMVFVTLGTFMVFIALTFVDTLTR